MVQTCLEKKLRAIEFLERRKSNLAADRVKLQRYFEQLREDYMELAKERANAPQQPAAAPQQAFKCILRKIPFPIHLDSPPVPVYTLQV